ncbi:MAG: glycosyltransferase [Firmicutes bacterium]|nr:glycosyltransferase [Bacillota bacterium]
MNILILTAKCGMGHYQCAKAIREKIEASRMTSFIDRVDIVDIYEEKSCDKAKFFYKLYDLFVDRGNILYNYSYKQVKKKKENQFILHWIDKVFVENFEKIVVDRKPDLVISTYSFASELMSSYKEETGSTIPLVTWITDVQPHAGWVNPCTDLYVVADQISQKSLVAMGVARDEIKIGGIPVLGRFDGAHGRRVGDKRRLLIMGGGLGLLPKDRKFYEALDAAEDVEVSVVTGKNKELYAMLTHRFPEMRVYGYVKNVDELMNDADILLTKAGGMTMFEAIQIEKPMLIFKPFLEQEVHNAAYIDAMHIGYVLPSNVKSAKDDVPIILGVLKNDAWLADMRTNLRRVKDAIDTRVVDDILCFESRVLC